MIAVVDSSALIAAAVETDPDHREAARALMTPGFELVIPILCITEVAYMLQSTMGVEAELALLESLSDFQLEAPESEDWDRIAALVRQYSDFPLGTVDASVVATAERLEADTIITLDQRHFRAIRPAHRQAFLILPD